MNDLKSIGAERGFLKNSHVIFDREIDYIPVTSIFTNITQLCIKILLAITFEKTTFGLSHHYVEMIRSKNTFRQIVLTSPFIGLSNFCVFVYDNIERNSYLLRIEALKTSVDQENDAISPALVEILDSMPIYLREDKEFILKIIKKEGAALGLVSDAFKGYKELVFNSIRLNPLALKYASDTFKNESNLVHSAILLNPSALNYASDMYKNERSLVSDAILLDPSLLKYASDTLKDDRSFLLDAILLDPAVLEYASDTFRDDRSFLLDAVKMNPLVLEYASDTFREDRSFLLDAVKMNPGALKYASDTFREDRSFVLDSLKMNPLGLKYASETFRDDEKFMLEAMKHDSFEGLFDASDRLKDDRSFVLEAMKLDDSALDYASDRLKNDRAFALEVVRQNPLLLNRISNTFQNNKEFLLEAVKQNLLTLNYISKSFKRDKEFVRGAVKQNGWALLSIIDELPIDFFLIRKMTNRIDLISALEEFVDGINEEPDIVSLAAKSAAERLFNRIKEDSESIERLGSTEPKDLQLNFRFKKPLQIFENEVIDALSSLLIDSTDMYSCKLANLQEMAADEPFFQVCRNVEQKRRGRSDFINKTGDMTFHFKK